MNPEEKMNNYIQLEIEKKFMVKSLPDNLESYEHHTIEQGYLSTSPVVRVRRKDDNYILTYKSGGLMIREEHEHPLTADSYKHLLAKADGTVISKTRYIIPDKNNPELTIELDVFRGGLSGFVMAEVEFSSKEDAMTYEPPAWFGDEVTTNPDFHNSNISAMTEDERISFLKKYAHNL